MLDEIGRVYVGSRVEGLFIKEMLEEAGIGTISKDALQASMQAGWADGLPADTVRIFVENENIDKAKSLIDKYIEERDTEK